MTRINKEVVNNEVRYTYTVKSKSTATYKVFNSTRLYKGCTGAYGGYDVAHKAYTVTLCYAR